VTSHDIEIMKPHGHLVTEHHVDYETSAGEEGKKTHEILNINCCKFSLERNVTNLMGCHSF